MADLTAASENLFDTLIAEPKRIVRAKKGTNMRPKMNHEWDDENTLRVNPDPQPFEPSEIIGMLNRTWETIGHDMGEENASAGDVLDFLVSSQGMYTDGRWDDARWEATERHVIDTATATFSMAWGMDR